jgi:diaminohydroxyphosphoribosylaminopyrimidine deaminase / 5-amino-6-(5-phosphoribosylamino)uracil reductase
MLSDEDYMREALELARRGLGRTAPNPAVGCLIVKNGKIIGRGFHEKAGCMHAEIAAIEDAKEHGENISGATMYVTLEPCAHRGRTPPCADRIVEEGLGRVVVAREDPNPKVSGKGLAMLCRAGIETNLGILESESQKMNEMYDKYISTGEPFVIAKAALSADGKMSAADGSSKWITGEEARRAVHELRSQVDAVMVGVGTVIADDPELTARLPGANNPIRIIIDPKLRTPSTARILSEDADTIIITTDQAPLGKANAMKARGIDVRMSHSKNGRISLKKLIRELGGEEITSIMIEGGGDLLGSAFDEGIVDKVMLFIAPTVIGGAGASIKGRGVSTIKDALRLERVEMKQLGEDFLLIGYTK